MPIPTSLGLHIEYYSGISGYVIVTKAREDRCTMLNQLEDWDSGSYGTNALSNYHYTLIDPSITTLDLLKLHYPELLL